VYILPNERRISDLRAFLVIFNRGVIVPAIFCCVILGREANAIGAKVGQEWRTECNKAGFGSYGTITRLSVRDYGRGIM